jgi:hypothetical protein
MKSTKDSPIMVNSCLMFPFVFGYKTQDAVKIIPELEIKKPVSSKSFSKKSIGMESAHLFKIYEIEGVSQKKSALFIMNDTELTEEIQFEAL